MRVELALALVLAQSPVLAADAPRAESAAPDPALLEFLGEFEADEGFVDPIALDGTRHMTLDKQTRQAERAARLARKEDQTTKPATPPASPPEKTP